MRLRKEVDCGRGCNNFVGLGLDETQLRAAHSFHSCHVRSRRRCFRNAGGDGEVRSLEHGCRGALLLLVVSQNPSNPFLVTWSRNVQVQRTPFTSPTRNRHKGRMTLFGMRRFVN